MDLKKLISKNVEAVKPDSISEFNERVAGIPDMLSLTLGEPDFNTPDHIKEAAVRAIEDNESHYTNPLGVMALRKAATKFMADKYGVHYDPETETLVTTGVSEALFDTFKALIDEGDKVLVPSPAFPVYDGDISILGGKTEFINTSNDGFKLTPQKLSEALKENNDAKAIIINFPSNPTGQTYTVDELKALADILKQHDIVVISDEIYSELTYGQHHHSLAEFIPDQTVVFNGLSKSHAMTGWRVGVVFAKKPLLSQIAKVHMFNTFNIPAIVQYAGAEAFANGENDALPMKKIYEERQALLLKGLHEAGLEAGKPEGAFYIFAKIPDSYNHDSMKFCLDLANQVHVGAVPGVGFGPGGEDYFRLSYATSTDNLKEAVKRIKAFMK